MQALPALRTHAAKLRLRITMRRVWGFPPLQCLLYPAGTAPELWLLVYHAANYRGCVSGNKRRPHLQSRRPIVAEKAPPQPTLPLRKNSGPGPLPNRWTWARGGFTSFEGGVLSKPLTHQLLFQIPLPSHSRKLPRSLK